MTIQHKWTFKARFRCRAFGWTGSRPACQRPKEAVAKISKSAKTEPVAAGDGVVSLMERIWPTFQDIDTWSGALGGAVCWAQERQLPVVSAAPLDPKPRDQWMARFWNAIEEDGVDYLSVVGDHWGQLCDPDGTASIWADRFLGLLCLAWSKPSGAGYVRGTNIFFPSPLGAVRRHKPLVVLALKRYPSWFERSFGVRARVWPRGIDAVLAYAEASSGTESLGWSHFSTRECADQHFGPEHGITVLILTFAPAEVPGA